MPARLSPPAVALLTISLLLTIIVVNRYALVSARDIRANDVVVETAEVMYVPRAGLVRAMFLGYDQAAADVMWLKTIDYFARHFLHDRRYAWLEHFIDLVVELDPQFRRVYHWAGTNVLYGRRFTNENVMRSNVYYEKALERFEDDSEAAYRLGVNYFFELKTKDEALRTAWNDKALSYFEMAANMPGAPQRMVALVASLYSRLGQQQAALQYLLDLYSASESDAERKMLHARIKEMEADVDLDAVDAARNAFESRRTAHFDYLSPDQYIALGEPVGERVLDFDWRRQMDQNSPGALSSAGTEAAPPPVELKQ
jgi:hypothetical protein